MRITFFVGILFCFLNPAPSEAQSLLDRAKAGFDICMENFPETKATGETLKNAGWRFEFTDGRFRAYSQKGRRVILATTTTSNREKGCLAIISKLTEKEAVALAQYLMKGATSVKSANRTENDSVAEWTAKVNGRSVRFSAMKSSNFSIVYGAAVTMVEE